MPAATSPPAKSTKPVPSRLRTPSTSLMMRDTRAPFCWHRRRLPADGEMCVCTCSRRSAISRWAAFESSWVREKEVTPWTSVANKTEKTRGPQQSGLMLRHHVVDQEFRGIRQHEARELVDHHQHKAQGEQSAPRTHQLPDFRPNGLQSLDLRGLRGFFGWRTQSTV